MNLSILIFFMFLSAIFTVVYQRRHLLMVLLSLESVTLMLVMTLLNQVSLVFLDSFLFITILAFGAIEASLGLALLVSMARKTGSDLVISLTLSKC